MFIADTLSRPVVVPEVCQSVRAKDRWRTAPLGGLWQEMLEQATREDGEAQKVLGYMKNGWPNERSLGWRPGRCTLYGINSPWRGP